MAETDRPYRVGYTLSGVDAERVFAALLDVRSFPDWAVGLGSVRALDAGGQEIPRVTRGATLEFVLQAAGLSHTVASEITAVEPPHTLEWRYVRGARGNGGWYVEQSGPNAVEIKLATDYGVTPGWLDRIAHRPFFKKLTEDLLRRSIRRFEKKLKGGAPRTPS